MKDMMKAMCKNMENVVQSKSAMSDTIENTLKTSKNKTIKRTATGKEGSKTKSKRRKTISSSEEDSQSSSSDDESDSQALLNYYPDAGKHGHPDAGKQGRNEGGHDKDDHDTNDEDDLLNEIASELNSEELKLAILCHPS
jgi:hypothetical protein